MGVLIHILLCIIKSKKKGKKTMKEFVTANGNIYACKSISTGLDSITMTMENQTANEMIEEFANVSELTVSFEKQSDSLLEDHEFSLEEPHGIYKNLRLESVSTNVEDGSVSVKMHIKSEIERRLDALEEGQELQNGAIDELAQVVGQ